MAKKGGLPAKYIKKYGMTKKAWSEFRADRGITKKKAVSTKKVKKRKRKMTKKKKSYRRKSKKFPISIAVGLGTSLLSPPEQGWSSPVSAIENGQMDLAAQSFIASWTGFKMGGIGGQEKSEFDAFRALNPLDMSLAPAWKSTFWVAIISKVIKKFIKKDPFSKIPFIGDYLSFS